MIVSDVSKIVKDEVNIMISLKPTADHMTRKGIQALVDNIRKSERSNIRKLYETASSRSRSIFADDEENQVKAEKLFQGLRFDRLHKMKPLLSPIPNDLSEMSRAMQRYNEEKDQSSSVRCIISNAKNTSGLTKSE